MPYYKLTDQNLQTYNGFQWTPGKWEQTDGKGELCTKHWLHCYNDPVLAVLLNPIHANVQNPRLFEIEVKGKKKSNQGLKFGFTRMRLVEKRLDTDWKLRNKERSIEPKTEMILQFPVQFLSP